MPLQQGSHADATPKCDTHPLLQICLAGCHEHYVPRGCLRYRDASRIPHLLRKPLMPLLQGYLVEASLLPPCGGPLAFTSPLHPSLFAFW